MPIYEYQCNACGAQFEKFFRSLAHVPEQISCPQCQRPDVQRRMSAPAIHAGGASAGGEADAAVPATPPVFGRKELKQAEEQKRQLKEQAAYEKKQADKGIL